MDCEESNRCTTKKKSVWQRPWLAERYNLSAYHNIIQEFRIGGSDHYRRYLRMNAETFELLLEKLRPLITKKTTLMRAPISAEEQFAITLRFLTTGESYFSLMTQYRVSETTIGRIVPRVCRAIIVSLMEEHMPFPKSSEEWKSIADAYMEKWNFPNCIGALDGKHVGIVRPNNSVSEYYNYKGYYSIIIMALVDADYKFINVSIGAQGRMGDATVFSQSGLNQNMLNNTLNLPSDSFLPGESISTSKPIPYVIVADDAFPLRKNIMKPYAQKGLSDGKRIFNYRLSRARRTSENAFGILASVFRIFFTKINLDPDTVKEITLACCILHNVLRTLSRDSYTPLNSVDYVDDGNIIEGEWRNEGQSPFLDKINNFSGRKKAYDAEDVRNKFKNFFQTVGIVPWQYQHVYTS